MNTSAELIGRQIKSQRKKNNLTQQELADLLGVDRQYLWKLENGKKNITLKYLDKIISALNSKHNKFLEPSFKKCSTNFLNRLNSFNFPSPLGEGVRRADEVSKNKTLWHPHQKPDTQKM